MKLIRLEAVRGAAALYVALGHTFHSRIFAFGQAAVIVFFLLSGFVIEYASAPKLGLGFRDYFLRRFIRIYAVLLCFFAVAVWVEHAAVASPHFWARLGGNLLMLQDVDFVKPAVIVPTLFSSALWSLHYEWWFYMLYFPVASRLPRRLQTRTVGIAGVIGALTYIFFPNALSRLLFYFPVWWIGVVMARQYVQAGRVALAGVLEPCAYVAVITALLFAQCVQFARAGGHFSPGIHPWLEAGHLAAALLVLGAALLWQKARWLGFDRLLGWGRWLAPISYALYIAHQPLFSYATYLNGVMPRWLQPAGYLLCLGLFCWIAERWFYPAAMRWRRRSSAIKPS